MCFPVNIAKLLRTAFKNTSTGCFSVWWGPKWPSALKPYFLNAIELIDTEAVTGGVLLL